MAVLRNIVLAASLIAPFALAAPKLDERAIYTHTYTEIAWVTVEETTTVWVDPSDPTPAPVATPETTSSAPPAVFAQPTSTPSTFATVVAVPSAATSSSLVDSSPSSSPSAPAPASPSTDATPDPASVNVQSKDIVASPSGTCEGEGNACVGDVTHWDGGLGACGWNVDSNSQMSIALPYAFMGTQSNGNPYCGRSVTLYNPDSGTTVQATVGDKCMGCVDRAIDCTNVLFSAITDGQGDGRMSGIEWWLN
ncbi:uncharacterized protein Z518_02799 [Rhinocladiella mackenziei CBS 650.93]|uniref:RlpA-like protein double-psi beta-barrel domain-containing protein n=1 Tax=Rhinocladiella mackenziei CBS 650.93 TaxID=1442369 RepID=A0A0D2HCH3_9EURO|nr:uncharacterized protein Z518_02799 [Rhinocladiella mackenziei CBS 650.93]KIX08143.1 hypothetical protein Z518_02799 [Rhinocladiella mackenziei CBS 650.93]